MAEAAFTSTFEHGEPMRALVKASTVVMTAKANSIGMIGADLRPVISVSLDAPGGSVSLSGNASASRTALGGGEVC